MKAPLTDPKSRGTSDFSSDCVCVIAVDFDNCSSVTLSGLIYNVSVRNTEGVGEKPRIRNFDGFRTLFDENPNASKNSQFDGFGTFFGLPRTIV